MQNILIDEEFRDLLPALDAETYALLEENLLENGCRDALIIWNNTLIDGHNRYEICTKHDIPFSTISKEFASREEVLIWIVSTQVSRRNLTPIQLSYYRGRHYRADKIVQGIYRHAGKSKNGHNDHFYDTTAKRLGKQYNVAEVTIRRDAKVADAIDAVGKTSPDAKRRILSGEISISKKQLKELSSGSADEIEAVSADIVNDVYKKQAPANNTPIEHATPVDSIHAAMRPLNAAIGNLSNTINSNLSKITKKSDRAELKTTLRSCIDILEGLCGQM